MDDVLATAQGVIRVSVSAISGARSEASPTSSDGFPPDDDKNADIRLIICAVMSSLGIFGNALVCFVMLRRRKVFHSMTDKLIIHQSFIDCTACVVFLIRGFALAVPPLPDNFLGRLYCRVWWSEWPQFAMFVTSTYNLVAISAERYLATCHPVRHRSRLSPSRLKFIMIAAWVAGWVPATHVPLTCHLNADALDCLSSWPGVAGQAAAGALIFTYEVIVPIAVMVFAYSRIIWSLRKRSRSREGNAAARGRFAKANRNVTCTLVVVAVFFVSCWLPNGINYLIYNLKLNDYVKCPVNQMAPNFIVLNLCINPFIYCFSYKRYRKQLRDVFSGRHAPPFARRRAEVRRVHKIHVVGI